MYACIYLFACRRCLCSRVAVCCSVLQCGMKPCAALCCSVLKCVAAVCCCSVLQCVAVCCSVLQCVVVCCVCGGVKYGMKALGVGALSCSILSPPRCFFWIALFSRPPGAPWYRVIQCIGMCDAVWCRVLGRCELCLQCVVGCGVPSAPLHNPLMCVWVCVFSRSLSLSFSLSLPPLSFSLYFFFSHSLSLSLSPPHPPPSPLFLSFSPLSLSLSLSLSRSLLRTHTWVDPGASLSLSLFLSLCLSFLLSFSRTFSFVPLSCSLSLSLSPFLSMSLFFGICFRVYVLD